MQVKRPAFIALNYVIYLKDRKKVKFRSDINGLRAIAVSAVLLYHFDIQFLRGGFAGVEVFFVISGFLMTQIIVSGTHRGNFKSRRCGFQPKIAGTSRVRLDP